MDTGYFIVVCFMIFIQGWFMHSRFDELERKMFGDTLHNLKQKEKEQEGK